MTVRFNVQLGINYLRNQAAVIIFRHYQVFGRLTDSSVSSCRVPVVVGSLAREQDGDNLDLSSLYGELPAWWERLGKNNYLHCQLNAAVEINCETSPSDNENQSVSVSVSRCLFL
jgi:hypothetical protein